LTFGFASSVDALSWAIVALLGLKVAATLILLGRDRGTWFQTRAGAFLWWSTKVTPLLAVPCMIAIALISRRPGDAWAYAALMVLVVIAVPLAIWKRFFAKG
jgi:hypothetical protein